jgi:hypothetical protein
LQNDRRRVRLEHERQKAGHEILALHANLGRQAVVKQPESVLKMIDFV